MRALLMLVLAGGVKASAQVVTNLADSGPGTLRSAITTATNGAVITFAPNLSGTIIMLASTLPINTSLTIDASALPGTVQMNGNESVQIFIVASGATALLNSLEISNGDGGTNSDGSVITNDAGGILNNGTLTLNQCLLSGNNAQDCGGILNNGILTLNNCTLYNNGGIYGGGIDNAGTVTLNQCAVWGNAGNDGGGIYNAGWATLNQCTVSVNAGDTVGGGICNDGAVMLNQCTLSDNLGEYFGGGIYNDGTVAMTNTIVAGNTYSFWADHGTDIFNAGGTVTYGGPNLVQAVVNSNGIVAGPAPLNADPDLALPGNYGGPTVTMPPLPGSPAIGAGSVAANTFATDQRGYARTQNGRIDLGTVELPIMVPFTTSPSNGPVPLKVQFGCANTDSDGSAITQWNWSFGDNKTDKAENPSHVYSTAGMFSPSLIVENSLGLTLGVSGPAITVGSGLTIQPTSVGLTGAGASAFVQFAFTDASGLSFSILATNHLTAPISTWPVIGTATENPPGSGQYQFKDTTPATNSVRYYILRQP
jgi:PKD repeat protein